MRNTLLLITILLSVFVYGCSKAGGECEEPPFVTNSGINIDFKDTSGKYLYREVLPLYNKDSLKVLDEASGNLIQLLAGLAIIPNTSSRYWRIDIGPLFNSQTDERSYNQEICKNFIVRYRPNEFDTLTTCFKSKKLKCGSVFETLKLYHKGQLIATANNETGLTATITKR